MKLRILSDLHLDVNSKYPFELKDKDTFTLLCGDTSGDPQLTTEWIKRNVHHGVYVSGNHLVYNKRGKFIDELRKELADADTGDCTYLDCLVDGCAFYRELDEKTVIVGSTMYTDFTLRGQYQDDMGIGEVVTQNKYLSERSMNDYRWGRVEKEDGTSRHLNANDLEEYFQIFFAHLKKAVEETFKDKDIIVVTHYCPAKKCINAAYLDSDVNASYIVDLADFIKSHPNIKLWVCGHVHHQDSFKIGQCRVIMNPRGYVSRCEDVKFDKKLWVDTKDWKVHKHKKTKKEQEDYNQRSEALKRCLAWFW